MRTPSRILGIEIGGTKLQFGVAETSGGSLIHIARNAIDRSAGAQGILGQIARIAPELRERFGVEMIGVGFGGPVDPVERRVITSHQVAGWDNFPLSDWCQREIGCPAVIGNDCNVAALAEARWGAGQGLRRVFYVTVGTGIGGGMVMDGRIDGADRPAAAEIGHLRPGLSADTPEATVESRASGLAIEQAMRDRMTQVYSNPDQREAQAELRRRCPDNGAGLTTRLVAQAATEGNVLAVELMERAAETLGWAIAQVETITAPQRVVIGGGVSLIGNWWLDRVRSHRKRFVFPPLADGCDLVPAELGELVVVHGAIALARDEGA